MTRDLTGKTKPCPMCGSKRIYMDEPNYDLMFSVAIQCADCGLRGFKNFTNKAKNPVEKTIDYWNTRAEID
jgi:Lar family restriction alleviation protein